MAKITSKTLGTTTQLRLTQAQHEALWDGGFATGRGGPQGTFARLLAQVRTNTGEPIAHTTDRVLDGLRTAARLESGGGGQDWAREVLTANGLTW